MENGTLNSYRLILPSAALLLLGAHALRQGDFGLTAFFAALVGLLFTRQGWVRLVGGAALLWGGLAWAQITVDLVAFRQAFGLPWGRLALIMGIVILLDGLAMALLLGPRLDRFFDRDREWAWPRAAIFILTVFTLALVRAKAPFPVLLADRYLPGWGWLEIFLLGFYAQWIGSLMASPAGHRRVRPRIWGLFSALFFLQLALGLSGMDRMLMTGTLHLPVPALIVAGPVFRGAGFFMLILFGVTLALVGPAWCSHLCYIGAWDDAMSRLGPRPAPSATLRRLSVLGRGASLVLAVGVALALRAFGVPGATAVLFGAAFGLGGVAMMVLVSRRRGMMVHCTTWCPMGLVANILGRLSPWRIRIGADCTRCGACLTRCRYNALDESGLERGRPGLSCTLCGDCVSACAHRQIGYVFPGLSNRTARALFIVLAVTLHAVFLGVARI
ncbi:4Fe-4S binding protein [Pseudodesulfovibrio indicus]|uniref:4Fe-4S binding protein n=1 Tax=Pseudodesulfovibrio indicus TaxID=1716143 RepID=A0A126QPF8_9BACT|nr:4Fe-4S binding protein [Pseudodesulfovibrio indicus]AMK11882.1 4Fe-4S ferredoxin [Pseudodesulfovibrio indicus]TDT87146.1 4Fe-4S binding protein [Pseudodesulfovibrio indicus]